jgi:hypothetical protein
MKESDDFHPASQRSANDGAKRRVHPWRIASARDNRNPLHLSEPLDSIDSDSLSAAHLDNRKDEPSATADPIGSVQVWQAQKHDV